MHDLNTFDDDLSQIEAAFDDDAAVEEGEAEIVALAEEAHDRLVNLDELYLIYTADCVQYETAFYDAIRRKLTRIVRAKVNKHTRRYSEDISQFCLIKVWRCLDSYDPAKGCISTWLHKIVKNMVKDQCAIAKREDSRTSDLGVEIDNDGVERSITIDDIEGESITSNYGWLYKDDWNNLPLEDLFNHDEALVKALEQSATLAQVERATGRSRKTIRHAVKMAKRRYAEMNAAA